MENIQLSDAAVISELQQWLRKQLFGNEKENGLYYQIAHNVANMEVYQSLAGRLVAFEVVLAKIESIANSHGTGLEEKVVFSRSGLN